MNRVQHTRNASNYPHSYSPAISAYYDINVSFTISIRAALSLYMYITYIISYTISRPKTPMLTYTVTPAPPRHLRRYVNLTLVPPALCVALRDRGWVYTVPYKRVCGIGISSDGESRILPLSLGNQLPTAGYTRESFGSVVRTDTPPPPCRGCPRETPAYSASPDSRLQTRLQRLSHTS